ncbi:MAG: M20/M25/M40 family metallo-hydrolase, partial [Calditrichia bacterium]
KWNRPQYPAILVFTRLHGGEAYNAIPESAELTATLRLTDPELWQQIHKEIQQVDASISKAQKLTIKFEAFPGAPPVINNAKLVQCLRENWHQDDDPHIQLVSGFRSMGGDDFGWYAKNIPAVMIRFGITPEGKAGISLHSSRFDVAEPVITYAVKFIVLQLQRWQSPK